MLLKVLDRLIFQEYQLPQGAVSLFRIVYALFILLVAGVPQYRWIAKRPDFFFDPPLYSLAVFWSRLPGEAFFLILDLLLVIAFVALLFGYYTRWATLATGLLMLVGFSFYYSFGKINHDALLMLYVPLVMFFSNWGSHYSLDALRNQPHPPERHWPVAFLALLLGFAMFSAGIPKLVAGWLDLSASATKGFVVTFNYSNAFPERYLQPFLVTFDNAVFWELLDYSAVLFEIGFLVAVLRKKLFRAFVTLAVVFHTVNILIFSISFINNLSLYLLFIDWRSIVQPEGIGFVKRHINTRTFVLFMIVMVISYGLEAPFNVLSFSQWAGIHFLTASLIVCSLAILFFTINYWQSLSAQEVLATPLTWRNKT